MKIKGLLLVGIIFAVFVFAAAAKQTGYSILGASPVPASQISVNAQALLVGLLYYVLTLGGIASGIIYDALGVVDEGAPIPFNYIRKSLLSAHAWRGLVASPLVFLTVYMGVRTSPVTTPFVLLAFQNGFFWKAAMSRIMNTQH